MEDEQGPTRAFPTYERRDCDKACYPTEQAARRAMRSIERSGRGHRWKGRLRPYLCKPCRAYHVGHSEENSY